MCIDDSEATLKEFEKSIELFENKDMNSITQGFLSLGAAMANLAKGIKDCDKDVSAREIEIFYKMIESFKDPRSLALAAGKNMVLNGVEIYHEMSAAYTNYKVGEYEGFGRDIGVTMALVFIGACDSKNICDDSKKAMKTMIDQRLYPTGLEGDDNSMYIAYLDMILRERVEAEYRAENPESPDDLVAKIPKTKKNKKAKKIQAQPYFDGEDTFYDANNYFSLLDKMSKGDQAAYLQ